MEVGLTSGCFDLLHFSHLLYLQRCKARCDRLIVGVDSDEMVRKVKGPNRPIIPENERLNLVSNLCPVYAAFILRNLEELPGVVKRFGVTKVFKHETFWNLENVVGVNGTGAELVIVPDIPGMVSTSDIVNRILDRYKDKP